MKITDMRVVEFIRREDGTSVQSLRFSTSYDTSEFKNIGYDIAFPVEAKDLAGILRVIANELDK